MARDKKTIPNRRKKKGPVASACHSFYHPYKLSPEPTLQELPGRSCHIEDKNVTTPRGPQKGTTCFCCRNTGHYANRCSQRSAFYSSSSVRPIVVSSPRAPAPTPHPSGNVFRTPRPCRTTCIHQPGSSPSLLQLWRKNGTSPIDAAGRSKTKKSNVSITATQDTMYLITNVFKTI